MDRLGLETLPVAVSEAGADAHNEIGALPGCPAVLTSGRGSRRRRGWWCRFTFGLGQQHTAALALWLVEVHIGASCCHSYMLALVVHETEKTTADPFASLALRRDTPQAGQPQQWMEIRALPPS